jgi:hypothetical protein
MSPRRLFLALAQVVSLLLLAGCAQDPWKAKRPKVVRAGGRVLYNGQPLEGAHVTFTNAAANVSAYARTGADGKFTLTTFEQGDGAVPGKQQISVSKVEFTSHADPNVDRTATVKQSPAPERRWVVPQHYGSVTTSGLTAEVPEGGKEDILVELHESPEKESHKAPPRPAAGARPDR